ncbi:hypothetical protein ACEWY4_001544 [Coilia grayii]|uniref:Reverse transcriptase domain-containing protein n=1 Tax=Coilia grayii TaxID=363190 RepID=A0ABD1KTU8_9TELE
MTSLNITTHTGRHGARVNNVAWPGASSSPCAGQVRERSPSPQGEVSPGGECPATPRRAGQRMKPASDGAGGYPESETAVATPTRPLTHTLPRKWLGGKPPKPLKFWVPYRNLKCGDCQAGLGSMGAARWRVHTKHPGRAFVVKCRSCGVEWSSVREYTDHKRDCGGSPGRLSAARALARRLCATGSPFSTPTKRQAGGADLRADPATSGTRWTLNELEVLSELVGQSGRSPQVLRTALARLRGKTERQIRGRIKATGSQLTASCGNVAKGGLDPAIQALSTPANEPPLVQMVGRALWWKTHQIAREPDVRGSYIAKALLAASMQKRNAQEALGRTAARRPVEKAGSEGDNQAADHLRAGQTGWSAPGWCGRCGLPDTSKEPHRGPWGRWADQGSYTGLGQFKATGGADNSCFATPFEPQEVLDQLLSVKKGSAAGPDGISVKDLREWDPEGVKLCLLFNGWLAAGYIPECVKPARTVLLPKSTDSLALNEPGNCRPITIGSMLLRLFSKVLHSRLSAACPISERQRGFIRAPGCAENLFSLLAFKKSHRERKTLALVFLDVAKAFDTVCHEHIFDALRQRGVNSHIVQCIRSGYERCTTRIAIGGELSEPMATSEAG